MVNLLPSDVIPIKDFEFAWRITDSKWTELPPPILDKLSPLTATRSRQLLEKSPLLGVNGFPFDPGRYHVVAQSSLEENDPTAGEAIRAWMRSLPIAQDEQVYVVWRVGEGAALVTDWATFSQVWDSLWYPFDFLGVFDDSLEWAVLFGPEEHAIFIQRGPVPTHLPISDSSYGTVLFRACNSEKSDAR